MKKTLFLLSLILMLNGCSILSELGAFTKCEFRLISVQDPFLCNIDVSQKSSWTDFSFSEGNRIAGQLLNKSLPFDITVNVEAKNPGNTVASVSSIEWIAYIDDLQVAQGMVQEQVKVAPSGGRTLIPVKVHADLIDFLEGDNSLSMLNFALNLVNAGDASSRVSLKIKPSVLVGSQSVQYPGYFTITHEFSSGN
jgi:LEA14-like dessication related protein